MLVNLNQVLKRAQENHYAVGLFNTTDTDMLQAAVEAAEETRSPIIIGTAEVLLPYGALELIAPALINCAERASVPVAVHYDHAYERKTDYLRDIVGAYLLKDILAIDGLKNSSKMRDLLRLIAFQLGSEVSYEELGKQLGMSKTTVEKYLDLLEKVFVIYRLGAYSRNLRKEVTKAGKWYFYDNGIRNAIIGAFSPLAIRQDVGALWENYIIGERRKANFNEGLHREFYFWRTYDKQEIDLIEESADSLTALEFKWGNKMPAAPKAFQEAYPYAEFHVVNRENYLEFV